MATSAKLQEQEKRSKQALDLAFVECFASDEQVRKNGKRNPVMDETTPVQPIGA